ncbi:hypothetical protein HPB47_004030, partial [Ixodes persulcatus]
QCTFTLTRLLLLKPLGNEVAFITIAVKMQSSKRTLRSNDILLPNTGGLLDTELDLSFSLQCQHCRTWCPSLHQRVNLAACSATQYPHFLKGAGGSNKLHVTLQRRKRYKNRAMLGYKTIATGVINMSEVLQRPVGRELELLGEEKERPEPVARIQVEALSTHPVQEEPCDARHKAQGQGPDAERSGDNTDDDEDSSSNDDASDSAPEEAGHTDALMRRRRSSQMRKRNIKQKFINLLKKFRVPDAEAFDAEHYPEGLEQELMHKNSRDLEDLLLDELDDLSDSGPEGDNMSLSSTPKPSLRPFFSSSTLVPLEAEKSVRHSDESLQRAESDSAQDTEPEEGASPPHSAEERVHKVVGTAPAVPTPRGVARDSDSSPWVLDQLGQLFAGDEAVPDRMLLVEPPWLATALQRAALPGVLSLAHGADLKAALAALNGGEGLRSSHLRRKLRTFDDAQASRVPEARPCGRGRAKGMERTLGVGKTPSSSHFPSDRTSSLSVGEPPQLRIPCADDLPQQGLFQFRVDHLP